LPEQFQSFEDLVKVYNRSSIDFARRQVDARVCSDFTELFQGGFEVFDEFLSVNVGSGEIVVWEPENVEVALSRLMLRIHISSRKDEKKTSLSHLFAHSSPSAFKPIEIISAAAAVPTPQVRFL
jgi:hypothetical protein